MPMSDPVPILSLGAGVQSSCLALMAEAGEVLPKPVAAIFADTQGEPRHGRTFNPKTNTWIEGGVYGWLDWLEQQLSFPVHRVTYGSLAVASTEVRISGKTGNTYSRTLVPAYIQDNITKQKIGLLGRRCTAEYKIRPLLKAARRITKVPHGCKTVHVSQWLGISYDEVIRMKPSQVPWAEHRYPLIDLKMTRDDCFEWMKSHGYPKPPRSACSFCPFHGDHEWLRLKNEEPASFQEAVDFEKKLQNACRQATGSAQLRGDVFLHASCVPLEEVEFKKIKSHAQLDMFANECTGLCGV